MALEFTNNEFASPELIERVCKEVRPKAELILENFRRTVLGSEYTPWKGRPVCRLCDRKLTRFDSYSACPEHLKMVKLAMPELRPTNDGKYEFVWNSDAIDELTQYS